MKKNNLFISFLAFIALVVISACSDSSTTPNVTVNYFRMDQGTFWVYDVTSTDAKVQPSQDSVFVVGTETKEGNLATKLNHYTNGSLTGTEYLYSDGKKLQALISSLISDAGGFPLPSELIPTGWATLCDVNASTWKIFEIPINNINVSDSSMGNMKINGKVTVTGAKAGTMQVSAANTTYDCQEFTTSYTIDFTITPDALPIPIPLKVTVLTHNYFTNKYGLVKSVSDPTSFSLLGFTQEIPGTTRILSKVHLGVSFD